MTDPSVSWIGLRGGTLQRELAARLGARDVSVLDIESADALIDTLRLHPKAAIVVSGQCPDRNSQRDLDSLEAALRNSPIVVLVERCDRDDHYNSMDQGVGYYDELSENPRRIARAVWWAASTGAA